MMGHQYKENGTRNMYSDYNQMKAYAECSPNKSKKLYLIDFSIEQSTKHNPIKPGLFEVCQTGGGGGGGIHPRPVTPLFEG